MRTARSVEPRNIRRPRRTRIVTFAVCSLALLTTILTMHAVATSPLAPDHPKPSHTTIRIEGTGTWNDTTPATLIAYHTAHGDTFVRISTANERLVCENRFGYLGDATVDNAIEQQRANITTGTCELLLDTPQRGEQTVRLHHVDGTIYEGVFTRTTTSERIDPASLPPYNVTGIIVAIIGIGSIVTSIVLAMAWTHERRFRDFLARRLFEETEGRIPRDWPEGAHHEKEMYARYVARAKN